MAVAQLVLEYIQALTWPAVVVGLAVGFRKQLKALAQRDVTVGVGSLKVELRRAVEQVEATAERVEASATRVEHAAAAIARGEITLGGGPTMG